MKLHIPMEHSWNGSGFVFRNAYQLLFCDSLESIILEHPALGKEFIWA